MTTRSRHLHLLLIDDDAADRHALRQALSAIDASLEVAEAPDGHLALELLSTRRFDCALLDYQLPDIDALDVLRTAQRSGVKTPIIILTAQGSEEAAVELMKAGAADYLPKERSSIEHLWKSIRSVVRVYHAERREDAARAERISAQRRLELLADAGAVLGSSLDYETTLASVARLTVPQIADWCTVDVRENDDSIRCIAVAHVDPSKVRYAHELRRRYPLDPKDVRGVANVLRRGEPELYPHIPDELLIAHARDEQHLRIMRELGMTSAMIVPLHVGSRAWGALTLISTRPERRYTADDLLLAEDLARRSASAVENARLYQQVKQAKESAERSKEAAEAANHAKDQFLAALSHELRTPLTPVLTMVHSLSEDARLSEGSRSAVEMIKRNVELEARLIDDLLDLTRIAKGKLQLDVGTVDVHEALRNSVEICQHDINCKRLTVSLELDAAQRIVRGDAARLQQVFWNLIKNAAKFTPAGGTIRISTANEQAGGEHHRGNGESSPVPCPAPRGARILISISDSGIGIAPEALPRIFDAFEQGERGIAQRFGGLGMGLAISKALIDLHRGTLSARSEGPGRGATFTVALDTVAVPLPAKLAAPPPAGFLKRKEGPMSGAPALVSSHRARILMVDDHPDTSTAMERLLRGLGYDVRTANSVESALHAADTQGFDVLISDIGLPDGSGLDLIRQLAARSEGGVKGIALSGFGMDEDIRRSLDAGFREHLTKPVNLQKLKTLIEQMIA